MIRRTPLLAAAFSALLASAAGAFPCTGHDPKTHKPLPEGCGDTDPAVALRAVGGDIGTADRIADEQLLERLRADAEQRMAANSRMREVIQETYSRVVADIKGDKETQYAANQGEVFGPMLDLQIREYRAIRDLRRQRLSPEEFAARRKRIEDESNLAMGKIPPGFVMDSFHQHFYEAVLRQREKYPDQWQGMPSGLPDSRHIGDMLRNDPGNAASWTLSAQDKLAAGDRSGGLADLNRAIAVGGNADAFALRAALRFDQKDFDGAYQDAKKALELNPDDKNARGLLKSAEGRISPVSAASLGFGGPGPAGGFGKGGTLRASGLGVGMTHAAMSASGKLLEDAKRAWSLGDYQRALALANRALDINPSNAAAHNLLAMIHARMRNEPMSIAAAQAGLALAPRNVELLNTKAFAENRAKRYKDALATANRAIEVDPRNALAYANRAHAYGGLGDRDAMLSDINRAAGMDPRFQQAAEGAAMLQLPSDQDILFLFPGEASHEGTPAAPARSKSFGLVVGAAALGGLLLALGLLSTVLAPLRDSVASVFRRATRRGPSVGALPADPPAEAGVDRVRILRGQYEIARRIGSGGMGMVYEGTDRALGRRVAIKKMRDELRVNRSERSRFIIEAKTVASLHHPNIVDIYAIVEEDDDVYLVFEFIDGPTVHDLLQTHGRLNSAEAVRVSRAMAEALGYAHSRGVIHRDMKPSNVMLDASGKVLVMDFGIARVAKDSLMRYSMTNTVVGTPPYMAPEQEQGFVRKESDVYALAVCAYEMLTGTLPFIGIGAGMLMNKINMSYVPPSRAIGRLPTDFGSGTSLPDGSVAGLPESLDEVFVKAFSADPERRYRTPQDFAAALEAAAGGARSTVRPA